MSAVPEKRFSLDDYIARERAATHKSEFYRGEIFAMTGGSLRHNDIAGNIYHALRTLLNGRDCRPYNSDQRIKVEPAGLFTYPDVSVICGPPKLDARDDAAVTNPRVIFEVLSESTESYDRGKKFDLYRGMVSLVEYILVSQQEPHIERFVRQSDNSWLLTEAKGLDQFVDLAAIECRLSLRDVYDNVPFPPAQG